MRQPLSIFSRILIGICAISLGFFVTLLTIQLTVLQRENIKTWLREGNAYENITGSLTGVQQDVHARFETLRPDLLAPVDAALGNTFTPANIQKQSEQAIDTTFDWLEGKTQTPPAVAAVKAQEQAFIRQLIPQLRAQLSRLPNCPAGVAVDFDQLQCRPIGMDDQHLAQEVAKQSVQESGAFSGRVQEPPLIMNRLPAIVQALPTITSIAATVAVISGVGVVVLGRERHVALRRLATRIGISMGVTALLGVGLLLLGGFLDTDILFAGSIAPVNAFLAPLTKQALPAIGMQLLFIAGTIFILAMVAYGGSRMWHNAISAGDRP